MLRSPPLPQQRKFAPKVPTSSKRAAVEDAKSRPTEEFSDPKEALGSEVQAPLSAADDAPDNEKASASAVPTELVQDAADERLGSGRAGRLEEPGDKPARRVSRSKRFSIAGESVRQPGRGSRAAKRGSRGLEPNSSPVLPSVFGTQDFRLSTVYLRRTEEVRAVVH